MNKMAIWKCSISFSPIRWNHVEFHRRKLNYLTSQSFWVLTTYWHKGSGGRFKNAYELANLGLLNLCILVNYTSFSCMSKIFCVGFQRHSLKFHTKYVAIHWKLIWKKENLQVIGFMSSYVFWNAPRPPQYSVSIYCGWDIIITLTS